MELSDAHVRELEKQRQRKAELGAACARALEGVDRILFEAGCGHGHWLTSYAEQNPGQCCIGIDLIAQRIRKGQDKCAKRGLTNLHFLKAELGEFLEVLPERIRFDLTVLLFPDPGRRLGIIGVVWCSRPCSMHSPSVPSPVVCFASARMTTLTMSGLSSTCPDPGPVHQAGRVRRTRRSASPLILKRIVLFFE